jgi:formamidopyrimidine-DNA glycosylase
MSMKSLLMDETFIVGLGDIYSDEILFAAGIRHDRISNKLSSQDVRRLYRALMETLQDAVKARGTTYGEPDFVDLHGDPGQYQLELKVFEREGEPCRRCRNTVIREKDGKYTTYLCPQCQT